MAFLGDLSNKEQGLQKWISGLNSGTALKMVLDAATFSIPILKPLLMVQDYIYRMWTNTTYLKNDFTTALSLWQKMVDFFDWIWGGIQAMVKYLTGPATDKKGKPENTLAAAIAGFPAAIANALKNLPAEIANAIKGGSSSSTDITFGGPQNGFSAGGKSYNGVGWSGTTAGIGGQGIGSGQPGYITPCNGSSHR